MIVVVAPTITRAWLDATQQLLTAGRDSFTSIITVENPGEPSGEEAVARKSIDRFIVRHSRSFDTQTVASTIFPAAMAAGRKPEELYSEYIAKTFPRIRRQRGNGRGTYFLRLIAYNTVKCGKIMQVNQLERVVEKMRQALKRTGPMRNAYELAVYHAGEDAGVTRGFPCLSHISLKLDTAKRCVHLTAVYRNQDYIERLYGNLLGLSRLQTFVANAIGYSTGSLTCHATHASLGVAAGHVRRLAEALVVELRPPGAVASSAAAVA